MFSLIIVVQQSSVAFHWQYICRQFNCYPVFEEINIPYFTSEQSILAISQHGRLWHPPMVCQYQDYWNPPTISSKE